MDGPLAILKMLHSRYISITKTPTRFCKKERKEEESAGETSNNEAVNDLNFDEGLNNEICRICLREGTVSVFGIISTEDLPEALHTIVGIEVSIHDSYPKYLCQPCHALLQGAILFREIAQQADKQLKKPKEIKLDPEMYDQFSNLDNHNEAENKIKEQNYQQLKEPKKEKLPDDHSDSTSDNDNETLSESKAQKPTISKQFKKPKVEVEELTPEVITGDEDDEFLKIKGKIHECSVCVLKFHSYEEYIDHKLTHMPKIKKESCSVCNKMFTPLHLKKHIASHKAEARSKINESKKKNLKHKSRKCNRCDLQFNSREEYNDHKQTAEHQNKKQPCSICNKTYGPNYIKKHMLTHKSEIAYICDICGKNFKRVGEFNNHCATHFDILPFKCSLCPYKGRRNADLTMHIRSHTGERPYQCEQCPQRFISKSNLNKHMSCHKVERDFKCEECGKEYRTKQELSNHYKVVHVGIREHICQYCNKVYSYRKHMMRHQRKVHKREKLRSGRMPIYLKVESMKQQENNL